MSTRPSTNYSSQNHMQQHIRTSTAPAPALTSTCSSSSTNINRQRQHAHLHAQLAQLNAHLADSENLVRMTGVQAQDIRFLGAYVGGLFMGSAKVLGEESVAAQGQTQKDGSGAVGEGER